MLVALNSDSSILVSSRLKMSPHLIYQ